MKKILKTYKRQIFIWVGISLLIAIALKFGIDKKVVVFDLDQTLGDFGQLSMFWFALQDYLGPKVRAPDFYALLDLYPQLSEVDEESGKMLIDEKKQQLALVLPRDHAKSTMAACAILNKICFATKENPEFICWVGEAQDQGIDNLAWIQNHLYENPAIHYYFGDLEGPKWTKSEFTTSNGCRMIAKGASQRLRGKKQLSTRYTGIVLDDFESELNTKTPESRSQIKNWVSAAVYPAIDFDKGGFLWCNGTIVHWDSFLCNIVDAYKESVKTGEDFAWTVYTKKAIEDGKPIWESRYPLSKLEEKKKFYIDSGTPQKFYQEYMNQARSPEDQIFSEKDITKGYYDGDCKWDSEEGGWYIDTDEQRIYVNLFIGVDPASTVADHRDFSVIMVVGVSESHDYYVIDYWRQRVLPMDCAEEIFRKFKQYKPIRRINIETIAYQEMLRDYVMRESKKRGMFLPGIEQGIKAVSYTHLTLPTNREV